MLCSSLIMHYWKEWSSRKNIFASSILLFPASLGAWFGQGEGMGWMHRIIDRIVGGQGRLADLDAMARISRLQDGNTICGMGDAAGYAVRGILAKYRH